MTKKKTRHDAGELELKIRGFEQRCRGHGLKVTPQRVVIYRELVKSKEHPSAEVLHGRVKKILPSISLDTVNRTLLMLTEIGAAFVVEGSGEAKRYDGRSEGHQHFRCVRCRRVIDFCYEPFERIELPAAILKGCKVLRKTVYVEGLCERCR